MLCCLFISQTEANYSNYFFFFFKFTRVCILNAFLLKRKASTTHFSPFGSKDSGLVSVAGRAGLGSQVRGQGPPDCSQMLFPVTIDLNFALLWGPWGERAPGGKAISAVQRRQLWFPWAHVSTLNPVPVGLPWVGVGWGSDGHSV